MSTYQVRSLEEADQIIREHERKTKTTYALLRSTKNFGCVDVPGEGTWGHGGMGEGKHRIRGRGQVYTVGEGEHVWNDMGTQGKGNTGYGDRSTRRDNRGHRGRKTPWDRGHGGKDKETGRHRIRGREGLSRR